MKVKEFNFLPFDEWDKVKDSHYKECVGEYTVEISRFFPTTKMYYVSASFPMKETYSYDFDEMQDINYEEQLKMFKIWYEETCNKVNKEFENYIHTYLISE